MVRGGRCVGRVAGFGKYSLYSDLERSSCIGFTSTSEAQLLDPEYVPNEG